MHLNSSIILILVSFFSLTTFIGHQGPRQCCTLYSYLRGARCFPYLGALNLFLSLPQVLLIVVQPVVNGFGQVRGDLGSGLAVARPVATGVFAEIGRGLGDDKDLVNVLVVQLVV